MRERGLRSSLTRDKMLAAERTPLVLNLELGLDLNIEKRRWEGESRRVEELSLLRVETRGFYLWGRGAELQILDLGGRSCNFVFNFFYGGQGQLPLSLTRGCALSWLLDRFVGPSWSSLHAGDLVNNMRDINFKVIFELHLRKLLQAMNTFSLLQEQDEPNSSITGRVMCVNLWYMGR